MEYRLNAMELWYQSAPGQLLVQQEQAVLEPIMRHTLGEQLVQIGGPSDMSLCAASLVQHKTYVGLERHSVSGPRIQMNLSDLPLQPNSVDTLFMAHFLEVVEDPKHFLSQAFQVLRPGGQLLLLGFNPWSLWGIAQRRYSKQGFPWCGHFYSSAKVKRWLRAVGYSVVASKTVCFRPPTQDVRQAKRLLYMEAVGPLLLPYCGGAFLIIAHKTQPGMTPEPSFWRSKRVVVRNGYAEPTSRNYFNDR